MVSPSHPHRQNATRYFHMVLSGVARAAAYAFVDASRVAAIGYCFGGIGALNLALAGSDGVAGIAVPAGLRGVVAFHGSEPVGEAIRTANATSRPELLLGTHDYLATDAGPAVARLLQELEAVGASYRASFFGDGLPRDCGVPEPEAGKCLLFCKPDTFRQVAGFLEDVLGDATGGSPAPAACLPTMDRWPDDGLRSGAASRKPGSWGRWLLAVAVLSVVAHPAGPWPGG